MTGEKSWSKPKKINDLLTHIFAKNITKLDDFIYAGAKLISEKIRIPLKALTETQTWWGNLTGNAVKSKTTSENDKTKEKR